MVEIVTEQSLCEHPAMSSNVHFGFAQLLVRLFKEFDDERADYQAASFVEICMLFLSRSDFKCSPAASQAPFSEWRHPRDHFTRPTLAQVVRSVRSMVLLVLGQFDMLRYHVKNVGRSESNIQVRTDGLILRLPPLAFFTMRQRIEEFNGGRGIRKASDLARPCIL